MLTDLIRPPAPDLTPFIALLWATGPSPSPTAREWVLPTGAMHLAFRLAAEPVRLYRSPADEQGWSVDGAVLGGARSTPFIKSATPAARSVGAMLRPGAARLLFGRHADVLAERHLPLSAIWGREARQLWQHLQRTADAEAALAVFEAALRQHLPRRSTLPAVVEDALQRFAAGEAVAGVQRDSGYSQRGFAALFRREVGLPPKRYSRVLRLQQVLDVWRRQPGQDLAAVALQTGFSDQSHLQREFRQLTGITPGRYRQLAPVNANHVPLWPGKRVSFVQDDAAGGGQAGTDPIDHREVTHASR